LINSGNKQLREFLEPYDIMYDSVQKRYSTIAMQFYREKLKAKIEGQ